MEDSLEIPQKSGKKKKDLPYDPGTPLLGIVSKELKSAYERLVCISMAAQFIIAKL